MDPQVTSLDFPPLAPSSGACISPRDWSHIFGSTEAPNKSLHLSFFPYEPEVISFSDEKLLSGAESWSLCLVGYSLGRRPYYEALLDAVKKTWPLKGSILLHSLSDGFFLFRFSCSEDFEQVWTRGVWFILGKPFILQKWHPKFRPKRENLISVPIWIKIHDLPLACWNLEGISRIASKVGIPLAADSLTEQKSRLTFARVCVQVDCDATYPEEILVSLDGDIARLKVQYELWPFPCEHCKSLVHASSFCPTKPNPPASDEVIPPVIRNIPRGRSSSRNPRNRHPNQTPSNLHHFQPNPLTGPTATSKPDTPHNNYPKDIGRNLQYQPHSPKTLYPESSLAVENSNPIISEASSISLPNLNLPTEDDAPSFAEMRLISHSPPPGIISPNRFDALTVQEFPDKLTENITDSLEDVCIIKTSSPVKPIHISAQAISGSVLIGNLHSFHLSVVYAYNLEADRKCLWEHLYNFTPDSSSPWIVMGDFNCCRYTSEKLGDPYNSSIGHKLKETNQHIADHSSLLASWVIQRAKVNWIKYGEDDLKFYGISKTIQHFQELYNPYVLPQPNISYFPVGNTIPEFLISSLNLPVSEAEIRKAVFAGSS
ncbi:hypothetical protein M5K25_007464 [Dendrobium thyrsiflorum]|uniref:DUF4283 domain-containing protein n=1 Tax=Dendrobium thyrsiflorum TaxID=117978 RepID=A0ABD0VF96_DENTH